LQWPQIGTGAFSGSGLKSIFISASVEVISDECFSNCNSLESVTFKTESKLQQIGTRAFSENGLKSIFIPASVEVISDGSFSYCKSLKSITFETGSKLQFVGTDAFTGSLCEYQIKLPRLGKISEK
jgi:hypothetical protein